MHIFRGACVLSLRRAEVGLRRKSPRPKYGDQLETKTKRQQIVTYLVPAFRRLVLIQVFLLSELPFGLFWRPSPLKTKQNVEKEKKIGKTILGWNKKKIEKIKV